MERSVGGLCLVFAAAAVCVTRRDATVDDESQRQRDECRRTPQDLAASSSLLSELPSTSQLIVLGALGVHARAARLFSSDTPTHSWRPRRRTAPINGGT